MNPEDTMEGTYTISSLASFDIEEFVALINPPEAGILAIGFRERPMDNRAEKSFCMGGKK
ncbi:2-oxo acid dehydrogenase subunit E2 [Cohnella silvisoli]|uniref:2-oxo acid dehydrogenase subunit E2 n=1 Tax=Cohnella silvisoli TaxID=2873699 RepID=A0ABV1KWZ5_9BACL|nr:2-oxo acid dehydrogenase subunit E2 [Cohnella silvisoli]